MTVGTGTAAQGLFQGPSLETESCGAGSESWSCLLSPSPSLPADHPGVVAEVGPGCRCGCVVHVGVAKPGRILATSTVSCPGRTLWLVQVNLCMQLLAPSDTAATRGYGLWCPVRAIPLTFQQSLFFIEFPVPCLSKLQIVERRNRMFFPFKKLILLPLRFAARGGAPGPYPPPSN